ncbi:MAG TPA: hypothetical protein VJC18_02305 [bacterium]|nr:hypothetical protein [bacterium]
MSKHIINMLYNPGSISTAGTGQGTDDQETRVLLTGNNLSTCTSLGHRDYHQLEELEALVQADDEMGILSRLRSLKEQLRDGMATELRPVLLKEFNQYMSHALQHHPKSQRIFQNSLEVILTIKKDIDDSPQTNGYISQLEWVELERSVYCLSEWEDGMKSNQEFTFLS